MEAGECGTVELDWLKNLSFVINDFQMWYAIENALYCCFVINPKLFLNLSTFGNICYSGKFANAFQQKYDDEKLKNNDVWSDK